MAKPMRFPRKLRQKLERVEANRDARAATGDPNARLAPAVDPTIDTLWRHFLPNHSVHMMWGEFDEKLRRFTIIHQMNEPVEVTRVFGFPPWLSDGGSD